MNTFTPGLYVVATPIGNLGDISERAAAVLRSAALIAAEDTRTTAVLLRHVGTTARAISLTEHNVEARIPMVLAAARDGVAALVSDAGTPVVSDPGARLVAAAHAAGVPVTPIPGPSAVTAAVSAAGFDGAGFAFLGFLPRKQGERVARLRSASQGAEVLVFFESPGRLGKTLADIAATLSDPEVVVCRELTKVHEETVRGTASELGHRFESVRGECTVVVRVPAAGPGDHVAAEEYLAEMARAGARRSAAAVEAARRFGLTRSAAYDLWPHGD